MWCTWTIPFLDGSVGGQVKSKNPWKPLRFSIVNSEVGVGLSWYSSKPWVPFPAPGVVVHTCNPKVLEGENQMFRVILGYRWAM